MGNWALETSARTVDEGDFNRWWKPKTDDGNAKNVGGRQPTSQNMIAFLQAIDP